MRNILFQEDHAKELAKKLEEFVAKKQIGRDKQELMDYLRTRRGILRL